MSGRKVNERIVSIPEVKKIMESVKEAILQVDPDEGMSHFQEITYAYVNKFAKMDAKVVGKIQKLLMETYKLEEVSAINIINVEPKTLQELRVILEKSEAGKALTDDQLKEIIQRVDELKSS